MWRRSENTKEACRWRKCGSRKVKKKRRQAIKSCILHIRLHNPNCTAPTVQHCRQIPTRIIFTRAAEHVPWWALGRAAAKSPKIVGELVPPSPHRTAQPVGFRGMSGNRNDRTKLWFEPAFHIQLCFMKWVAWWLRESGVWVGAQIGGLFLF
jgi:hypothetical protein